jgi:hypothetical protein
MQSRFNTVGKYHLKNGGRIGDNTTGYSRNSSLVKIRSFSISLHLNRSFRRYFSVSEPGTKPIAIDDN